MGETRVEHDSLGEVHVPERARWGAQTQRAVENFPVSGVRLERRLIRALALVKAEAALVNGRLRAVPAVDAAMAAAVHAAALEVADGRWDDEFPIDVFQTGSGTSSNMNANEVIASLASERLGRPVHPNDHVNASQSSNDVFPSAIRLAAGEAVSHDLVPALEHLADALRRKGRALAKVVKAGRTHLMDAVPVTLGQELEGYAAQVEEAVARYRSTLPRVLALPLGGTAVGTGLNCPKGFAPAVIDALASRTGLEVRAAPNRMAAQGAADALVELSGQSRAAAVALHKIANDLRWMASGPGAGLGEIVLPALQPGSSIMPGKVNPVIPEAVAQVAAQVIGDDAAVAFAGAQGAFELNTYLPVIARDVLEPLRLLANVARLLADRCVAGITADVETCARHAASSPAIATSLAPRLGYEATASVVQQAIRERRSIRDVVVERGLLDAAEADRLLDVVAMAKGGLR
jgi:fumarate hydratase, class II